MALSGKSLNAAMSVGAGIAVIPDTPKQIATMTVTRVGTPTFVVALEGSVDGEDWFGLNSTISAVTISTQHSVAASGNVDDERVCIAFRANLTSFTDDGSGTSSVSASIAIKE